MVVKRFQMDLSYVRNEDVDINDKIKYVNKELKHLLTSCEKFYRKYVPRDQIRSIRMEMIWRTLQSWDGETKYSTYLYYCLNNKLKSEAKKELKFKSYGSIAEEFSTDPVDYGTRELIKNDKFLTHRFTEKLTYEDIGKIYDKSHTWAENKVKKSIKDTRRYLNGV